MDVIFLDKHWEAYGIKVKLTVNGLTVDAITIPVKFFKFVQIICLIEPRTSLDCEAMLDLHLKKIETHEWEKSRWMKKRWMTISTLKNRKYQQSNLCINLSHSIQINTGNVMKDFDLIMNAYFFPLPVRFDSSHWNSEKSYVHSTWFE